MKRDRALKGKKGRKLRKSTKSRWRPDHMDLISSELFEFPELATAYSAAAETRSATARPIAVAGRRLAPRGFAGTL